MAYMRPATSRRAAEKKKELSPKFEDETVSERNPTSKRKKKKRFSKQDEKQHLFFFFTPSRHGRRVRGEARMKVRSARRKRKAGKRDVHMPKLSLILCLEARSLQMLKTASANEVHFCQTRGGNGKECVGGSRIILSLCETARWPLQRWQREKGEGRIPPSAIGSCAFRAAEG